MFLTSKENKQKIITLIAEEIRQYGCSITHAIDDADVDTVKTTLDSYY